MTLCTNLRRGVLSVRGIGRDEAAVIAASMDRAGRGVSGGWGSGECFGGVGVVVARHDEFYAAFKGWHQQRGP